MKPFLPLKDGDAEAAVQRYLAAEGWWQERARKVTVHRPWDPDFKPFQKPQDFFGAFDFMAFHPERGFWWLQVTGGGTSAISERRRKIAALPLPLHLMRQPNGLRVSLLNTQVRQDPATRMRRRLDFAVVHDLFGDSGWGINGEVVLPRKPDSPSSKKTKAAQSAQKPTTQAEMFDPNDDPNTPPM